MKPDSCQACVTWPLHCPMQGWLMARSSQLLDPAAPFACHSVGTILFTAIGISLVAIAAHGAFRVPDDLFLDDGEVFYPGTRCRPCRLNAQPVLGVLHA